MSRFGTNDYRTLTILRSQAMGRADGRASIRLETKEEGSIAFEVDQRAIDALRGDLVAAEQLLRQTTNKH